METVDMKDRRVNKTDEPDASEDGKLIRVSKEADDVLTELWQRLNKNEDALKTTKWSLASYLIEKSCPSFGTEDIKSLYMKSVTDMDLIRTAYKRAMETGVVPDNLREILFANVGLTPGAKKSKKPRRDVGSNATVSELETA